MVTAVWAIQIVAALFLIILILLHSPKGDGIAGIGGSAHLFTSQKGAEKNLNKITTVVTVVFTVCVFLLGFGIVH